MSKCVECDGEATEASGLCFYHAEELAVLLFDAAIECGYTREQAIRTARAAWEGA